MPTEEPHSFPTARAAAREALRAAPAFAAALGERVAAQVGQAGSLQLSEAIPVYTLGHDWLMACAPEAPGAFPPGEANEAWYAVGRNAEVMLELHVARAPSGWTVTSVQAPSALDALPAPSADEERESCAEPDVFLLRVPALGLLLTGREGSAGVELRRLLPAPAQRRFVPLTGVLQSLRQAALGRTDLDVPGQAGTGL